jgi:hypothetical protein
MPPHAEETEGLRNTKKGRFELNFYMFKNFNSFYQFQILFNEMLFIKNILNLITKVNNERITTTNKRLRE